MIKECRVPNTLTPEMKAEIETMTALSGAELDREFTNIIVAQHQKEVEMFRDQAEMAQTLDVKKYAEDLLPRLECIYRKRNDSKVSSLEEAGNRFWYSWYRRGFRRRRRCRSRTWFGHRLGWLRIGVGESIRTAYRSMAICGPSGAPK